MPKDVTF